MILLYILVFINLIWLSLMTFSLYQKNKHKSDNSSIKNIDDRLKVNILRFNPFSDIGGDQSFILTILDKDNSGVILTSLHNRDITRIYAKAVKHGEGDNITLSKEEKLAIVKTIKG